MPDPVHFRPPGVLGAGVTGDRAYRDGRSRGYRDDRGEVAGGPDISAGGPECLPPS
jgi:hypothetical protein